MLSTLLESYNVLAQNCTAFLLLSSGPVLLPFSTFKLTALPLELLWYSYALHLDFFWLFFRFLLKLLLSNNVAAQCLVPFFHFLFFHLHSQCSSCQSSHQMHYCSITQFPMFLWMCLKVLGLDYGPKEYVCDLEAATSLCISCASPLFCAH